MTASDTATIQALRGDLAFQIARHVERSAQSQVVAAKRLDIPQPTLSKIMNGRVTELSLELLIRIAVRAGMPIVLQTGKDPAEAGVSVSGGEVSGRVIKSRLADEARAALSLSTRRLTPEQRLEAHLKHSQLVTELHDAGQAHQVAKGVSSGRRSR